MSEPTSAIDSILDTTKEINGLKIFPITIGRYALLELVDSPFINPQIQISIQTIIPSLYIMSNEIKVLAKYNSRNIDQLKEEAVIWSENINLLSLDKVIKDILEQVTRLNYVSPDQVEDTSKKNLVTKDQTEH